MNNPQPTGDHVQSLLEHIEKLEAEIVLLKKKADDREWSLNKTNQGIKILYKELEAKNKDLQKLDELKSDFVSTVSHELRTPLAITNEGINLVLEGVLGPITEKQRHILERGKENLKRLRNIIDDLLDISKIEAGKIELNKQFIDLVSVVQDLIDSYRVVVEPKNISLTAEVPDEEFWLYLDEDRIIQVMNNLLNNAIKFTPDDGRIVLSMVPDERDVAIKIQDSGVGIAKDDLNKLFKKFQQLSRTSGAGAKGTGLGLSVVKALVELHHGQVWASSERHAGTTFGFSLPYLAELKDIFDRQIDHQLSRSESLLLILLDFELPENARPPADDGLRRSVMNRLLQAVSTDFNLSEKKFFPYGDNRIVLFVPDDGEDAVRKICRDVRRQINGMIFVYRDTKIDARVRVGTALSAREGADRNALVTAAEADMNRRRRILVVDDNEQIVHYLGSVLANNGYEVKQTLSGEQCLQLISESIPDLLVLDIKMPDLNGYELYGRLKGNPQTAQLPVLIYTEQDVDSVRHSLSGFDVAYIVNKSDKVDRLLEAVMELT